MTGLHSKRVKREQTQIHFERGPPRCIHANQYRHGRKPKCEGPDENRLFHQVTLVRSSVAVEHCVESLCEQAIVVVVEKSVNGASDRIAEIEVEGFERADRMA